jgi:hypothetical protein
MNELVGDEIQHHEINIGRGWDREGGSFMLVTFLMDLCLGASFHTINKDLPSKEPR